MRKKAEEEASEEPSKEAPASAVVASSSQTWAMLIKRVYEVDPLSCPQCGGEMKVVAFIEPPQSDVIEEILRHCGLWQASSPRAPPDEKDLVLELDAAYSGSPGQANPQELTYVDIDTFGAFFNANSHPRESEQGRCVDTTGSMHVLRAIGGIVY